MDLIHDTAGVMWRMVVHGVVPWIDRELDLDPNLVHFLSVTVLQTAERYPRSCMLPSFNYSACSRPSVLVC
jgi:hypothetical protein